MGARGPAPKPTRIKLLQGNPDRRPLNLAEPRPRPMVPPCPPWLDLEGKREWKRITRELDRVGLLTVVDRAALAGYCQAWSRWRDAEMALSKLGMVVETASGYLQPRPEVAIARQSLTMVHKFCREFGLTPSSRAGLSAPGVDDGEEDPFD